MLFIKTFANVSTKQSLNLQPCFLSNVQISFLKMSTLSKYDDVEHSSLVSGRILQNMTHFLNP